MILQTVFKTQFEVKADVEANKYLLLQKMTTLNQKQDENIIEYFKRAKNLTRHLFNATKTIDYNVVKKMKNKSQKKLVNFECNKNRDFLLRKSNRSFKQHIRRQIKSAHSISNDDRRRIRSISLKKRIKRYRQKNEINKFYLIYFKT